MAQYDDEYGNAPRDSGTHQEKRGGSALPWVLLVLVLGMAGAAGYFGYGMYQAANEQKASALKASEEAGGKLHDLQAANKDLEEKVKGLEQEKGSLSAQVQAKDEELAKLKATYDSLKNR